MSDVHRFSRLVVNMKVSSTFMAEAMKVGEGERRCHPAPPPLLWGLNNIVIPSYKRTASVADLHRS